MLSKPNEGSDRPGRSWALPRLPRPALPAVALAALLSVAGAACDGDRLPPEPPGHPITVYTRNLFLGASLTGLATIPDADGIAPAVGAIWSDVEASRYPERAQVIAAQIAAERPDVVALQEVSLYRRQLPGDWRGGDPPNATEVALDFLAVLQAALADHGADYAVIATVWNGDAELPASLPDGTTFDLRLTDRDVILARAGVTITDAGSGSFAANLTFPVGGLASGATAPFKRGYVMADVTSADGGARVRVVNSHLEVGGLPQLSTIQVAQARELLGALAGHAGPMILTGDFNSAADGSGTQSYRLLTTTEGSPSPFKDVWPAAGPAGAPGLTCCLQLEDPSDVADTRIDLILFRGALTAKSARVIGFDPPGLTPAGLWASDHLGVQAHLEYR